MQNLLNQVGHVLRKIQFFKKDISSGLRNLIFTMVVQLALSKHVNGNLVIYFNYYALLCNVKFGLSRF